MLSIILKIIYFFIIQFYCYYTFFHSLGVFISTFLYIGREREWERDNVKSFYKNLKTNDDYMETVGNFLSLDNGSSTDNFVYNIMQAQIHQLPNFDEKKVSPELKIVKEAIAF